MQNYDIFGQQSGKIWHRNPNPSDNGIAFQFNQSGKGNGTCRRFLHTCFMKHKNKVLAADHVGGVFLFDFENNRYTNINQCGQSCTAIAAGLKRGSEYMVALADSSVKCYSTENKELVSWMRGHESDVHSISIHPNGRFGATTSRKTAQLWNLDTFQRLRKLNVRIEIPILEVIFLPTNNIILTCFIDDTIFGWENETFEWKFKLNNYKKHGIGYKAFAVTRDGLTLVAGGKSRLVHLYSLATFDLVQMIKLPDEVHSVKQLHFLADSFDRGSNKIMGALCDDGVARYIDISTCQQVFEIRPSKVGDKLTSVCTSMDNSSNFIIGTSSSGSLLVYDVTVLMADYDKPPGPIVRTVRLCRKSSQLDDDEMSEQSLSQPSNISSGRLTVKKYKYELNDSKQEWLSLPRLRNILRGAGVFPDQHRFFIWRNLLKLPENQSAFTALTDKGEHLAFGAVEQKFPIKSIRLSRVMQRILSALSHWSKIFAEIDYLPLVVFPFVKLFQNNSLICFETISTFIMNWFQHWFEFFPNPPVNVLSMVENLLAHHDKDLLRHLIQCDVTTQVYAWPLMQTIFSEVFSRNEWMRLFDHVFTAHPGFFYHLVAAYSICCRSALLRTSHLADFKYFYHHRNALDVKVVISEAYRMASCTPKHIDPLKLMSEFEAMSKGETYPIFNKFPHFIVDYQSKERERIRKEELEYLRERRVTEELKERMTSRKEEEQAWYQRQEILDEAENERRRILLDEESKLANQRKKLAAMKRELKTRELELLDRARIRFVNHQQQMRSAEIGRIEDEIRRKAFQRDEERASAVDDVDIRGLELEIQRASLEQQMAKEQVEHGIRLRQELETRRHAEEKEKDMQMRGEDDEADLEAMQKYEKDLATTELKLNALNHRNDIVSRLMDYDVDREKNLAKSLSKSINNHRKRQEVEEKLAEETELKRAEVGRSKERVRFLDEVREDCDDRRKTLLQERNLEECRQRIRESENKLRDQLETIKSKSTPFVANDRSSSILARDEDVTTAVSNLNALKEIEKDQHSISGTWTYDNSRMQMNDEEQEMLNRAKDLRKRLLSHRKPC